MFKLPFHKWTLQFYSKEHELLYQQEQRENRLFCLRLYNLALFIACLVALFVFIAQEQSGTLIYIQSGLTVLTFFNILIGKLFINCFRTIFTYLMHYFFIPSAAFVVTYGSEVPLFVLGYGVGALLIFILQNMENKMRLICACSTPFVFFGIFHTYNLSMLQYICFTIVCAVLSAVQLYRNEYNQRLVFAQKLIIEKQRDLISDFVKDGLMLVSLDERSRQFELEFYNKQIEQELNIGYYIRQTRVKFNKYLYIRDTQTLNNERILQRSKELQ